MISLPDIGSARRGRKLGVEIGEGRPRRGVDRGRTTPGRTAPSTDGGRPRPPRPAVAVNRRPPPVRPGAVRRWALLTRLARISRDVRLVLLVAPPGYGKTTTLAQWGEVEDRRLGWVQLDDTDNDPATMVGDIAAAARADWDPDELSSVLALAKAGRAERGGRRARDGAGRDRTRRSGAGRPAHDPAQRGPAGRRGSGGRVAGRVGDRGRRPVAAPAAAGPAAQPGPAAGVRAGGPRVRVGRDRRPAAQARRGPARPRGPEDRRAHRGVAGRGLPGRAVDRRASRSRPGPPGRSPAAAATSWTTSSKRC